MIRTNVILATVNENPGWTSGMIAAKVGKDPHNITAGLHYLLNKKKIRREGNPKEYRYYPSVAVASIPATAFPLGKYTPRDLLAELKRRGYKWDHLWYEQFVDYSKI